MPFSPSKKLSFLSQINTKLAAFNISTSTYESGPSEYEDFARTDEPVYILGEVYSALTDREALKNDIQSRIWITYRRNFQHIGGTGPSSDQGWGCMLRCGQMMLAQALLVRHLGRKWRWKQGECDERYWKLLRMFEDKKMATYSIHQIASMGEAEGKAVGQWFGPNTIAQVLKRISSFDDWSEMVIHVALDNVVVKNDIRKRCLFTRDVAGKRGAESELLPDGERFSNFVNDASQRTHSVDSDQDRKKWKPLFLIIPLRLGLTDINPIYFNSLKKCLAMKQSVGIIGGKPNHAHYFIGYMGKELIYLDPHTTQNIVDLEDRGFTDDSYHCLTPPSRMSFHKLDPSIALGFFCGTEEDFEALCRELDEGEGSCRSMFEIRREAPEAWTSSELPHSNTNPSSRQISLADFQFSTDSPSAVGSSFDDEEFEII